jgi:hypothetical protein
MPNISKVRQPRFWSKWEQSGAVVRPTLALFEQLEDEIRYDCHRTEIAFNRAYAKKDLVKMGPCILRSLADHIRKRFPNMKTTGLDRATVDWNMFGVWVWLISCIRREYNLPAAPYASHVTFQDQDMQAWHTYCLNAYQEP